MTGCLDAREGDQVPTLRRPQGMALHAALATRGMRRLDTILRGDRLPTTSGLGQ